MGMSTHITGFKPPDEKWQKMKSVWESCEAAGVRVPEEVDDFFAGYPPDRSGVEVNIKQAVIEYNTDYACGYEVHINDLPKDVKIIRFFNSW